MLLTHMYLWTNHLCISFKHILVHVRLSLNYQNQTRTFQRGLERCLALWSPVSSDLPKKEHSCHRRPWYKWMPGRMHAPGDRPWLVVRSKHGCCWSSVAKATLFEEQSLWAWGQWCPSLPALLDDSKFPTRPSTCCGLKHRFRPIETSYRLHRFPSLHVGIY